MIFCLYARTKCQLLWCTWSLFSVCLYLCLYLCVFVLLPVNKESRSSWSSLPIGVWMAVHRPICRTMSSQSALSCHGSISGLLSRTHLWSQRYRLTTYGRRAFSVAGPTAWNRLPVAFRDPTISDACFRRHLKTVLFAQQRRHHSV